MAKVLGLYYSTCGHIETMAQALAEGAHSQNLFVGLGGEPWGRSLWLSMDAT